MKTQSRMQNPQGNKSKRKDPAWFRQLARIADAFPLSKTRVVGVGFDMRAKVLEIEFSNAYALVIDADGASRLIHRKPA